MKRLILSFLTGAAAMLATSALAQEFGPLVSPAELAELAKGAQARDILDIRAEGFDAGHITGALAAPYSLFRGPADNPGAVPAVADLEALLERLGLEPSEPVVIVSQGDTDTDFGAAARVYWTLKSTGFTQLAVLNGGATAWVNAGLPLSKDAAQPAPSALDISWDDTWTADTATIERAVSGQEAATLIDARPAPFFEGKKAHDAADRPGTLPGAQNLPHTEFFRPGATAIGGEMSVAALKARLGADTGAPLVSFCNTGHWAATDWFAMSELAGIENVKLYPGSMVEYSQTGGEMQNQPGLFANFWNQLTGGN
ncbi:sulfurtransferase [Pelagivirga sediminicola]|uniref:Sulfurtransferase n=1 Tax=Pelagivirga sediminicola TaxID=2170575 RepID=A0A2T7G4R2_9RHOB|nr:rhodanese-like domain-containing protein [Pelagivirga sediminicola]PVA09404.1 sulfurtransferase [Pelagivirga sediminicola]